jgi:glycosyltransferase involved in cell wall biosynthesis
MKFIRKVTFIHEWDDLLSMEGTIGERSGRFYQSTLGRLESAFDSHFRKYGDAHIVVSEYLKNRLIRMGVPADRILANYHYGSRYADKLPLSVSEARQKSGIFTDKFILAYAGKMFIRDADLFYKVLNALPETIKANMKLLIINTALPYNLADAGIDVLSFDRLSDDDFFIHLCTANAFILPYQLTIANLARWPSKFADYCSIGRAVLSTPIADLPAIYQEYQPGILTKDDSVSDLLNGICQLVENTSKTIEMGERAKAYAYNELRLSILAQQLDGFYKNVLLGKP